MECCRVLLQVMEVVMETVGSDTDPLTDCDEEDLEEEDLHDEGEEFKLKC